MQFKELIKSARDIQEKYRELNKKQGHNKWSIAEYMQGFTGDVGDLAKLIMAKQNYRQIENGDEKLAHELADCLWSVIIISEELGIDLEQSFIKTMHELEEKLDKDLRLKEKVR